MKKVKLPPLKSIKGYEQFYKYLTRGIPMQKGLTIDVTAVYLNKENEKALSDRIKHIVRSKNKHYTDDGYEKAWAMYWLQFSPSTAKKNVPKGYALIDVKKIYVLPNRGLQ